MKSTICVKCIKITRLCGQGFTNYVCKLCKETKTHHNTCTPLICEDCSFKNNICQECEKPLKDN
jgi:hypothetical protein